MKDPSVIGGAGEDAVVSESHTRTKLVEAGCGGGAPESARVEVNVVGIDAACGVVVGKLHVRDSGSQLRRGWNRKVSGVHVASDLARGSKGSSGVQALAEAGQRTLRNGTDADVAGDRRAGHSADASLGEDGKVAGRAELDGQVARLSFGGNDGSCLRSTKDDADDGDHEEQRR